jgi:hypothetical protein
VWPGVAGGTVVDGGVTWKARGFHPGSFTGCNPMTLAIHHPAAPDTVIAQEGDAVGLSQLSGWGEFLAMNNSGKVAFHAAIAGYISDEDEAGSGLFTAGPGAGALALVAKSGDIIGGRFTCGFSTMVAINNNGAGQVLTDGVGVYNATFWQANHAYALNERVVPTTGGPLMFKVTVAGNSGATEPTWPTALTSVSDGSVTWKGQQATCDEELHGLVRVTLPATKTLLVAVGSSFAGSTVTEFGGDTTEYENIDGIMNESGHVPVVLKLANGDQVVYNMTGALAGSEIARTGATYTSFSPRTVNNNSDQVAFKGVSTAVDRIFRFTPGPNLLTVVSVGDDLGTRTTGTASGRLITFVGNYFDMNNLGHIVFEADDSELGEGYYYWNGTTLKEIYRQSDDDTLASELLSVNDQDVVAYVTGATSPDEDDHEDWETGGLYFWTASGGIEKAIAAGDIIGGNTVSTLYAQHHSFIRRQLNGPGCVATAYNVNGDDPGFDCDEGNQTGSGCGHPLDKGGQLFVSCATLSCPPITLLPTTLPAGSTVSAYDVTDNASGGLAPYTFAVTAGSLPSGITLSSDGHITGTATGTGLFTFTITATDANQCTGTRDYAITIGSTSTIPAFNPLGLLLLALGLVVVGGIVKR